MNGLTGSFFMSQLVTDLLLIVESGGARILVLSIWQECGSNRLAKHPLREFVYAILD